MSTNSAQVIVVPGGSGRNIINVSKSQKPKAGAGSESWLRKNDGRTSPLKIDESGPNASKPFGLEPKKATESAILTFRPSSAASDKVAPGKSNWAPLAVN